MKQGEFLNEIKGFSAEDLKKKSLSLAEELMKLRFRKASGQLPQSSRLRDVRRNLARVLTLTGQKRSTK